MNRQNGFTLLELMVTLTIAAIVMAIAVPSIRDLQSSIRISTTANTLASNLKDARSKALVTRRNVSFQSLVSGDWAKGWGAVFTNPVPADPAIILRNADVAPDMVIAVTPNVNTVIMGGVSGMVQDGAGAMLNVRFRICDSGISGERGADVQINQFGRVAVIRHTSGANCT